MTADQLDTTTKRVILGLAMFFAGLIGLVVVVGLANGSLDPVAMVTILSGIFTGLLSAFSLLALRSNKPSGHRANDAIEEHND